MALSAGPSWTFLNSLEAGRLEKGFGSASGRALRVVRNLRPLAEVFGLDKKVFRAALRECVPTDHAVATILGEPEVEQALRAARAYERLRGERHLVPELPHELAGEGFLLWSSYCLKPRDPRAMGLEVLCVRREDVPDAVLELWARIYLSSRLRALSPGLGRAEVAIGLVAFDEESRAALLGVQNDEEAVAQEIDPPFPSFRSGTELACALEESFLSAMASAWARPLRKIGEKKTADEPIVLVKAGEARVSAERLRKLLADKEGELEGRALELALGEPKAEWVKSGSPGRRLKDARKLMRAIWDLLLRAPEAARLEARKSALKERVLARSTWMREMDLAILPDDGLKQTLVELVELTTRTASLSAESELLAALHGTSYLTLTGLDLGAIDAGLELPTYHYLLDFEEAMTRVRVDPLARTALLGGEAPEAGPGLRALDSFYRKHREMFGGGSDLSLPRALIAAARGALERPIFLEAELRRAQADADRKIAAFEEQQARPIGASLSPLRSQARGLLMIREAARALEVRVSEMVLLAVKDIDRRLGRLEPGMEPLAAYHATLSELVATVDMTGPSLRARTMWRKADALLRRREPQESSQVSPFVGLALRRGLPELLHLAYESGPLRYSGRESDTLPCSARMLGRNVVIV